MNLPESSEPLEDRAEFYQTHLDRVSRSFAFCIARLSAPFREQVGLCYLLCRLLDTIEDAEWSSFEVQKKSFDAFDQFLKERPGQGAVELWKSRLPTSLPAGELLLLEDAYPLLSDFHALPPSLFDPLQRLILSMSGGMRHFMKRKSIEGELRLKDTEEVNQYCFFVAGVVGEMLQQTIHLAREVSAGQLRDAYRFGLFLQKVNLLKDQLGDEPLGRYLVPSRKDTLASLLEDGEAAFRYLQSLKTSDFGFRLFCAWCLFLGLASLPFLQKSFEAQEAIKIPRDETAMLLGLVESVIDDDEQLIGLYAGLRESGLEVLESLSDERAREFRPLSQASPAEVALSKLYLGDLPKPDVLDLFRNA